VEEADGCGAAGVVLLSGRLFILIAPFLIFFDFFIFSFSQGRRNACQNPGLFWGSPFPVVEIGAIRPAARCAACRGAALAVASDSLVPARALPLTCQWDSSLWNPRRLGKIAANPLKTDRRY
jgi:hypothetical protein